MDEDITFDDAGQLVKSIRDVHCCYDLLSNPTSRCVSKRQW